VTTIPLDHTSPHGSRDQPEHNPQTGLKACAFMCSYSVLLPAGLAVPPSLRSARWSLTPPFHPYPGSRFASEACPGRSVLCGAIP